MIFNIVLILEAICCHELKTNQNKLDVDASLFQDTAVSSVKCSAQLRNQRLCQQQKLWPAVTAKRLELNIAHMQTMFSLANVNKVGQSKSKFVFFYFFSLFQMASFPPPFSYLQVILVKNVRCLDPQLLLH